MNEISEAQPTIQRRWRKLASLTMACSYTIKADLQLTWWNGQRSTVYGSWSPMQQKCKVLHADHVHDAKCYITEDGVNKQLTEKKVWDSW